MRVVKRVELHVRWMASAGSCSGPLAAWSRVVDDVSGLTSVGQGVEVDDDAGEDEEQHVERRAAPQGQPRQAERSGTAGLRLLLKGKRLLVFRACSTRRLSCCQAIHHSCCCSQTVLPACPTDLSAAPTSTLGAMADSMVPRPTAHSARLHTMPRKMKYLHSNQPRGVGHTCLARVSHRKAEGRGC